MKENIVKLPWLQVEPDDETKAQLARIEAALVALTKKEEIDSDKETQEMAQIDEIRQKIANTLSEVRSQGTKIASINSLMDGMRQQIIDLAAAGGASQEVLEGLSIIFEEAKKNSADINTAIAENTAPENPPPPPPPVE